MKLIYFIAASGALATSCGPKTLDCQPRTVNVTGPLETDILGSWDGFGLDSRVVATFHDDERLTFVAEESWAGPQSKTTDQYRVLDGKVSFNGSECSAEFDEHSLTLCGDFSHPALTCHGKEFE